eukprot:5658199-Prymnesium_polylepis.1
MAYRYWMLGPCSMATPPSYSVSHETPSKFMRPMSAQKQPSTCMRYSSFRIIRMIRSTLRLALMRSSSAS